jgi:hypothetical protein
MAETPADMAPGTRVLVTHLVRVGHLRWSTTIEGTVESVSVRPIGGIEMGSRSLAGVQPTLRIRMDDGEIAVVALDEWTRVEVAGPVSGSKSRV